MESNSIYPGYRSIKIKINNPNGKLLSSQAAGNMTGNSLCFSLAHGHSLNLYNNGEQNKNVKFSEIGIIWLVFKRLLISCASS
jgi:hypothetical protein